VEKSVNELAMQSAMAALALGGLLAPMALAQVDPHQHHQHHGPAISPAATPAQLSISGPNDHAAHAHGLGPAGSTYDLRWLDAMVQHHTGALRMSEFVFDIGQPGVGALAKAIWNDQAREIVAMAQWRKAWYPDAPTYPVVLQSGGNPDAIADLIRMDRAQIEAMQMVDSPPTKSNRVTWFLEGMLAHHGGALVMAHDALNKSVNPTIRRLARQIIVAQRHEIIELRRMLNHDGFDKPEYFQYDPLFTF